MAGRKRQSEGKIKDKGSVEKKLKTKIKRKNRIPESWKHGWGYSRPVGMAKIDRLKALGLLKTKISPQTKEHLEGVVSMCEAFLTEMEYPKSKWNKLPPCQCALVKGSKPL